MKSEETEESELKKWLRYLYTVEPPNSDYSLLTEYQKEDIEFAKQKIAELRSEINEKKSKKRDTLCHSKLRGLK